LEGKLEFRGYYYMFDSYERELYSVVDFKEKRKPYYSLLLIIITKKSAKQEN
jgi:hypothetical protein